MSDACKDLVFDIDEQLQYAQSIAHKPCHITKGISSNNSEWRSTWSSVT